MHINLNKIRSFIAVAETLSFRTASERLNLSQPAVSNHIRDLEETLGVSLFKRTTRNVVLSPEGENFLIRTRRALADLDDVVNDIIEQRAPRRGRVNFGCVPPLAHSFMPAALSRFYKLYPNVKVQIFDEFADRLYKRTLEYEVDFMVGPAAPSQIDLEFNYLKKDRYVAIMPAGHRLADRKSVRLADLTNHPFILLTMPDNVRIILERAFAAAGLEFVSAYTATNYFTIGGMIEAGLGITALPNMIVPAMMSPSLRCVPIARPSITRKIGILRRKNEPLTPAAQALAAAFAGVIKAS
jgi:LysR family transcriptional regulator, carnitine catabolism transcriptional activator